MNYCVQHLKTVLWFPKVVFFFFIVFVPIEPVESSSFGSVCRFMNSVRMLLMYICREGTVKPEESRLIPKFTHCLEINLK